MEFYRPKKKNEKNDHIPIYVSVSVQKPPTKTLQKGFWDYESMEINNLTETLLNVKWDEILRKKDVDEATQLFTSVIVSVASASIAVKTIHI